MFHVNQATDINNLIPLAQSVLLPRNLARTMVLGDDKIEYNPFLDNLRAAKLDYYCFEVFREVPALTQESLTLLECVEDWDPKEWIVMCRLCRLHMLCVCVCVLCQG